jgi:hypothetical protein
MGIKPTLELNAKEMPGLVRTQAMPRHNALAVVPPPQMVTVPAPFRTPATTWGAKRTAKYFDALTAATNAQSGYLRSRAELAKSFVAAARAANEVAELPEICEADTQVRRLHRERDFLNARTEVEQARYGFYATQDEVDKLRRPRIKKAARNGVAINALMKSKIDMEALGEDTTEIDRTLVALQQD